VQPQHCPIKKAGIKMRTIRTKVYQFSELSEQAKQKAIEWGYYLNVSYDWWKFAYEDAEKIGLKIKGFDIDRGSYCKGDIIGTHEETAKLILEQHGNQCDTYTTAKDFLAELKTIEDKYKDEGEDNWDEQSEIENAEDDFLKALLEDYRIILQNEYEYLTSDEAVIETIQANEYEFTQNGRRF
jgi:myo-inositol catabolism protein IolC